MKLYNNIYRWAFCATNSQTMDGSTKERVKEIKRENEQKKCGECELSIKRSHTGYTKINIDTQAEVGKVINNNAGLLY